LMAAHLAVGRWRELRPLLPPMRAGLGGVTLISAGTIFLAELLAALAADPFARQAAGGIVSVRLWGATWDSAAPATWLPPLYSIAGGMVLVHLAPRGRRHAQLSPEQQATDG